MTAVSILRPRARGDRFRSDWSACAFRSFNPRPPREGRHGPPVRSSTR